MTSRYSPVAPIALLEKLFALEVDMDQPILGNYLLLLTHDVLSAPERYENLILDIRERYEGDLSYEAQDTFIIMDNSLVELGEAMSSDDVIEAACVVEADCIMTPDALGDSAATRNLIEVQKDQLLTCDFPLMKVPQGANNGELVECIEWLRNTLLVGEGNLEYWGIPRWIATELGSRIPIVQYINMTSDNPRMHLLGMSQNFEDDTRCAMLPDVIGIDSANPLVIGYMNMALEHEHPHVDRGNYWDNTKLNPQVVDNIEYMRRAITY